MGCAFSQESEDSRYRRKIQHQNQRGIQNSRNRSPHQRSQRPSQQQGGAPAGRTGTPNNVYSPVVAKTATVNTRGSRTVTPVSVPTAAPVKTTSSSAGGSPSATDGGACTPSKASEPEDIHFRRQHFDRNSVLRHSKKRSRKASSPYATAASSASKSEGGGGKGNEDASSGRRDDKEKAEVGNNSSSSNTSIKENSSAAANRPSAAPKRNATTISISDDGSSRVITNGAEPSPAGSGGEKDQNEASSVSPSVNTEDSRLNKQQISSFSPQKRRTSDLARPRVSSAEINARTPRKTSYDHTNRNSMTSSTSTGTRTYRASEQGRLESTPRTATTRQRSSSRNGQDNQQKDVIMAEDKSDECGRLI